MEKIILGGIEKCLKDNTVICQHGFMSGKSCFSNLILFYGKVTHPIDQGKSVDALLNFSKVFDIISHYILLDKMSSLQLHKNTMWWVSKWLMGQVQRVTLNGCCCHPGTSGVLQASFLALFSIFINKLNAGLKRILNTFVDYIKLGRAACFLKERPCK